MNPEPHLKERVESARAKAQKIVNNLIESEEDLVYALRLFLSKIYGLPIFSDYFEKLELDRLIFEAELHRAERQTVSEKTNELINENKDELAGMFDDWEDQDLGNLSDTGFSQDELDFMKTGDFKNDQNK